MIALIVLGGLFLGLLGLGTVVAFVVCTVFSEPPLWAYTAVQIILACGAVIAFCLLVGMVVAGLTNR